VCLIDGRAGRWLNVACAELHEIFYRHEAVRGPPTTLETQAALLRLKLPLVVVIDDAEVLDEVLDAVVVMIVVEVYQFGGKSVFDE